MVQERVFFCTFSARLWYVCANDLLPADRPRGHDDRANRDRDPRDAGLLCERHEAYLRHSFLIPIFYGQT
jgi:hypothetical protein